METVNSVTNFQETDEKRLSCKLIFQFSDRNTGRLNDTKLIVTYFTQGGLKIQLGFVFTLS